MIVTQRRMKKKIKDVNRLWLTNNDPECGDYSDPAFSLDSGNNVISDSKDREEDKQSTDAILMFLYKFSDFQEKTYSKMMNDFITDPSSGEHYHQDHEQIKSDDNIKNNDSKWIEIPIISEPNT